MHMSLSRLDSHNTRQIRTIHAQVEIIYDNHVGQYNDHKHTNYSDVFNIVFMERIRLSSLTDYLS